MISSRNFIAALGPNLYEPKSPIGVAATLIGGEGQRPLSRTAGGSKYILRANRARLAVDDQSLAWLGVVRMVSRLSQLNVSTASKVLRP